MQSESALGQVLRAFHRMHHNRMRALLRQRGLRDAGNPPILLLLQRQGTSLPLTQRQIADQLGVAPPTVAVSIQRMEKAGLICKESDPHDQRKNAITITEKGRQFLWRFLRAEETIAQEMTDGFTAEEYRLLLDFYARMIQNLRRAGDNANRQTSEKSENPDKPAYNDIQKEHTL